MAQRILLVDDHEIVREGLRSLIESDEQMQVVGQASTGRQAVDQVRQLQPDVVLMDICMPEMDGVEATRRITREMPGTKVVALSMIGTRQFVNKMLEAGAAGYLVKKTAFRELARAIEAVARGDIYLTPDVTGHVMHGGGHPVGEFGISEMALRRASLNDRETQIVHMFAEGKSTKEIALEVNLSPKTIDACRRRIMEKLGVASMAELTKYAIRAGLTSFEF
jgi:DNA-binding NarL/FixJ family response regulator